MTDYTSNITYNIYCIEQAFTDGIVDSFTEEACVLLTALKEKALYIEGGSIVTEDIRLKERIKTAGKNIGDKVANSNVVKKAKLYINKIIIFLKQLVDRFMAACRNLVQLNDEWINMNANVIENISDKVFKTMTITVIPYWNGSKRLQSSPVKPLNDAMRTLRTSSMLQNDEEIMKAFAPDLYKTNPNDVVAAAKVYFRGGSNELIQLSGSECKKASVVMLNYCRNYQTYCREANNDINRLTEDLRKLETDANILQNATESVEISRDGVYSLMEGSLITGTELALNPIYDLDGHAVTFEELGVAAKASSDNNSANNKNRATSDEEERIKMANQEKVKNELAINKRARSVIRIHIKVAAARLTILEECYVAYVKTLKSMVGAQRSKESSDKGKKKNIVRRVLHV